MEVYLDNSATTRVYNSVVDIMTKVLVDDYGNPSSMHIKGFNAENHIKSSRETIASALKVQGKEIYFTSGGTESNNTAIIGTCLANRRAGNHIITTEIEHPSVSNTMKYLQEQGFDITYLPVDSYGFLNLNELANAVDDNTILATIIYVNNEIGTIQPIDKIIKIIKEKNPNTIFHTDAVQAFGKTFIYPKRIGIDLMSISGHKIHGPKGIGAIYKGDKIKITPITYGGGQESGLRNGTENVPAIAGFGMAVEDTFKELESKIDRLYGLREYFIDKLLSIEGVAINGPIDKNGASHIINASFLGIKSEVLLHSLEERSIYVSSGSACSSNKPGISQTLKAIRVDTKLLDGAIRFSLSYETTKEELEYCVDVLNDVYTTLRRYIRK